MSGNQIYWLAFVSTYGSFTIAYAMSKLVDLHRTKDRRDRHRENAVRNAEIQRQRAQLIDNQVESYCAILALGRARLTTGALAYRGSFDVAEAETRVRILADEFARAEAETRSK